MQDFASAAMVRLLQGGRHADAPPPRDARVPISAKRDAVAALVAQAGLAGLMTRAARVDRIAGEPLHQALILARGPQDFASRWQRLERYVHSSHAVRVIGGGALWLSVEHGAADPRRSDHHPQPAESLTVAGVWAGALQAIGTQGLVLQIDGQVVFPAPSEPVLVALAAAGRVQRWTWHWSRVEPAAPQASELFGDLAAQLPWPDPAAAVARRVLADPSALPALGELARGLHMAPRSLQRKLAAQGASLRFIVGEVRARMAAWCLLHSAHPVAEIGFLCGYTDQPHFTREFTRRAGAPPAAWRSATATPRRH